MERKSNMEHTLLPSSYTNPSMHCEIITAESGQNVTLTCRAPNNKNIVVEWSRADLEPEHVFVYRNEKFDPDNQNPSFKNRVDLQDQQMKHGDMSVILKNVTTADSGTYECRVQRENGTMELISIINLRVVFVEVTQFLPLEASHLEALMLMVVMAAVYFPLILSWFAAWGSKVSQGVELKSQKEKL
uniref:Ig-like domain-containing protein n=1 Tax=Amphilophus citrinellus TaxID=61819 RepID=A0A3Q0RLG9_AMPCI